jgi:hypothetical protein
MIWLIATTTVLAIIFAAYVRAKALERPADTDKPSFQPTIFLKTTPSEGFWDPNDSALNTPLLVSEKNFGVATSSIDIVTRNTFKSPLLGRSDIVSSEPSGYGLYSYLLFGSSSEAGKSKRYAAARGYCQNFKPSKQALTLYRPENINVFLVPTEAFAPESLYCKNPETLVDVYYDYILAGKILQEIGLIGGDIYLVACHRPILTEGCRREKMLVFNLTRVAEDLSELYIIDFRDKTRQPEYWSSGIFHLEAFFLYFRGQILPEAARFLTLGEASAKGR